MLEKHLAFRVLLPLSFLHPPTRQSPQLTPLPHSHQPVPPTNPQSLSHRRPLAASVQFDDQIPPSSRPVQSLPRSRRRVVRLHVATRILSRPHRSALPINPRSLPHHSRLINGVDFDVPGHKMILLLHLPYRPRIHLDHLNRHSPFRLLPDRPAGHHRHPTYQTRPLQRFRSFERRCMRHWLTSSKGLPPFKD